MHSFHKVVTLIHIYFTFKIIKMKKITLLLLGCLSLFGASVMAQNRGNGRPPMDPAKQKARLSKELQDSLGFSAAVADTAAGTNVAFQQKTRTIFMDQSIAREDKMTQVKAIMDARDAQLKTLLSEDEYAKYTDFEARQRKNRPGFGGGRGRGGNGGDAPQGAPMD